MNQEQKDKRYLDIKSIMAGRPLLFNKSNASKAELKAIVADSGVISDDSILDENVSLEGISPMMALAEDQAGIQRTKLSDYDYVFTAAEKRQMREDVDRQRKAGWMIIVQKPAFIA